MIRIESFFQITLDSKDIQNMYKIMKIFENMKTSEINESSGSTISIFYNPLSSFVM